MNEEDILLVLKDLSARLPYGVKCDMGGRARRLLGIDFNDPYHILLDNGYYIPQRYMVEDIKPYLRSMSSMTVEEEEVYLFLCDTSGYDTDHNQAERIITWLEEHHFDYRGLIERGLALEAPKDMYK